MKFKMGMALLLVLVLAAASFAVTYRSTGNDGDTPTGTPIEFLGDDNPAYYKNSNATSEPTTYGITLEVLVTTEAGFSLWASPVHSVNQPTSPGIPVTYEVGVTNEGNATFTFVMTKSNIIYTGGADSWEVTFIEGGNPTTEIRTSLPEDDDIFFTFRIAPSSIEAKSPDASTGTVELTSSSGYTTPGTPEYWGVNGLSYGGFASSVEVAKVTIQAPVMALSRASVINKPTGYTGGANDAVPGAVITYTITYTNEGSGNATEVVIADKVPDDTQGYHVNKSGDQTIVNISPARGTATGWRAYYSTELSPSSFVYGNYDDWTLLGTLESGQPIFTSGVSLDSGATYVKWEKLTVLSTEAAKTLTWGVTIN